MSSFVFKVERRKSRRKIFFSLIKRSFVERRNFEENQKNVSIRISANRPSLLQAAIRSADKKEKNVVLFDLQGAANCSMFELIEHLFNKQSMLKLSHAFPNDLAQLKVFLDENCFQKSKIERVVELSDVFRQTFAEEKNENLFSLKRMAELTLQTKLNKKQQCANWSKRPLQQAMKDYAAIDVVVMIEIFDRFSQQIDDL